MTPFPPMVPPYTGQCIRTGRERAAFRSERIRYFITRKQVEVSDPAQIAARGPLCTHHFAAHGDTNKIPAHFGGGFSRDFNRAVDAGWRDFFERRGMPPPQTSSYISIIQSNKKPAG